MSIHIPASLHEIAPHLFQGDGDSGPDDIAHLGRVAAVIDMRNGGDRAHTAGCCARHGALYLNFPIDDADYMPHEPTIRQVAAMVNVLRRSGNVIVKCAAGLNRSGLVTAYALMLSGMSADAAINLIRDRRDSMCLCNQTFAGWLRAEDWARSGGRKSAFGSILSD